MVDAKDLKSFERKFVPVRVRPPAPISYKFIGATLYYKINSLLHKTF